MQLADLDMSVNLLEEEYKSKLFEAQLTVFELSQKLMKKNRSAIIVFEGWDAAGKGGAIRRLTERLDPRHYVAHPIAAPQGEDKSHHYLYRFWRRLPHRGQIAIFDRSWYGRVLVERIEGFCQEDDWRRAYREINEFEAQVERHGATIVKLWVHISKEEQLKRFEERGSDPLKNWKLTPDDWRNRDKWDAYVQAIDEMFEKTSTEAAPWTIVPGNDKRYARVKVLQTVAAALSKDLS
jgi:polyphosphate kinase 2 (PPK2 family)